MRQAESYWSIPKLFDGELVVIIGGGASLKGYDLSPFHQFKMIGCNDAYRLGDCIDVVVSGDKGWIDYHTKLKAYQNFKGLKVSIAPGWHSESDGGQTKTPKRLIKGASEKAHELGWNDSTGAAAIDLARKMGACRILLLGFDMKLSTDNQNNWHENIIDIPNPDVFARHILGCQRICDYMKKYAKKCQVFNCGPDSVMKVFPMLDIDIFYELKERR